MKEIVLAQPQSFFRKSNCDAFLESEGKIHEVRRVSFGKLSELHLATSVRTISQLLHRQFSEILSK